MNKVDLHTHSTASDGSEVPGKLPFLAKDTGLSAIALTDHDTVDGLDPFLAACKKAGVEGVGGIEISSRWHFPCEVHLLGYFVETKNVEFCRRLEFLQQAREDRNALMIRKLQSIGIDVTLEEWQKAAGGEIVGRPHLAHLLIQKGVCRDMREVFGKYIGTDGIAFVPKEKLTTVEAVRFLREFSVAPVLAHPGLLRLDTEALRDFLNELKDNGLVGMECIHSDHDEKTTRKLLELAFRLELVPTGGSDFHGTPKPHVRLGVPEVPFSYLSGLTEAFSSHNKETF
ncbi:MAG: phosphoesterase [Acidobacteria bacterium CG_4_9_14_3_um_filter_49_7]|nr:MAG: phosphoesterase [Acidobacteria bacterium CG_4_9_14_3_um_filter_49_7]